MACTLPVAGVAVRFPYGAGGKARSMSWSSSQRRGSRWRQVRPWAVACITLVGAPLVAGCGSSGAASTIPVTAGLSLPSAVTAVCARGLRVQLDESVAPPNSRSVGHAATSRLMRVTGTTPPAGTTLPHGFIVTVHFVHPSWEGEELSATTGDDCLVIPAPPPLTASQRAAVAVVAGSAAWHAVAVQFPATNLAAPVACVINGGGSTTGISVPGTCDTLVSTPVAGITSINYTEIWPAARFSVTSKHTGDDLHTWSFTVGPTGQITSALSLGDTPPQAAH